MKICYLAGANSIHSHKWIKYFAESGNQILWISLSPSIQEIPNNIDFLEVTLKKNPIKLLKALNSIKNKIKEFSPEVMHVHSVGTYGLLALITRFKTIIATPWGSDLIYGKNIFYKRIFIKKLLTKAKLITCDAHHMLEKLKELSIETSKIKIINFGIDAERFKPLSKNQDLKKTYRIDKDLAVISLRNFEPVYDIHTLIKAIPYVIQNNKNIIFLIVGKGSQEKELKELAKKLGVEDVTIFLGFIPNEELPEIINSMDIYVSTSLSDAGIASSTAEAMACGIPVIVTNSGENSKWIESGENGYLVKTGDYKDLADKIIHLLENKEKRHALGVKSRKLILEQNDYKTEMKKMHNLYYKIANSEYN